MTASPAHRPATYADIEALPPHVVGEVLEGVLYVQSSPKVRHALTHSALLAQLVLAFQLGRTGPGGYLILFRPELRFREDVVVPDLAAWRNHRIDVNDESGFITTPPDWIGEILSDATARLDRGPKRSLYAREGVGHLWLIDPAERFVEAFVNTAGLWKLVDTISDDAEVALPPFEAARFPLPLLWPLSAPSTPEDGL